MTLNLVPFRGHTVPVLNGKSEVARYSLQQYLDASFQFNGQTYYGSSYPVFTSYGSKPAEPVGNNYPGYAEGMLFRDGPLAAAEAYRLRVFGQASMRFQEMGHGRAGDLFDDESLDQLHAPWVGGSTGDLMKRALLFGDLGGNGWIVRIDDELVVLRPDWVTIVLEKRMYEGRQPGQQSQVGWRQVGIAYHENGVGQTSFEDAAVFRRGEYAHFVPGMPDPLASWRGMSWMTPIVREVQSDIGASDYGVSWWSNSATPNLAVSLPKEITPAQFESFVDKMDSQHKGALNAGRTLYTAGGADVTVVGANMQQIDYSRVVGKIETRIANASGVPATLLGFSEGMQGSSLNSGNYAAAKRNFVDTTMRDLWANWCGSMQVLFPPPPAEEFPQQVLETYRQHHGVLPSARLWYDGRDIPFLLDDAKDLAERQQLQAATIVSLITGGFKPASVVSAVSADDLKHLEHTGLTSVQLVPPGTTDANADGVDDSQAQYEAQLAAARAEPPDEYDIERRRYGSGAGERVGAGNVGGGRFRKLSDEVVSLIEEWLKGDREGDPLEDWEQPQLKAAASQLGLTEPRARYTKAQLKSKLLGHVRGDGGDVPDAPEPKAVKKAAPRKAPAKKAAPKRPRPADLTDAQLDEIADAYRIGRPGTARGESALAEAAADMAAGENREQVALNLREHAQELWEEWDRGNDVDLLSDPRDAPREKTPNEIRDAVDDEWDRLNRLADALDAIDKAAERKEKAARRPAKQSVPTTPDPEQSGRDQQAAIDHARKYASVAGELDEILHNESSDATLLSRLDAAGKRHGISDELAPVLDAVRAGDRDSARAAMARLLPDGVTQDSHAGATTRFDPKVHTTLTGRVDIAQGAHVEVVRPGFSLERDGEKVRLSKAVVEEVDAPAPQRPRVNSTPSTEPPPTPPNPQSPWGQIRDDPRFKWSRTHGRMGNLDQVDAVYVAPSRDAAREYLQTRDGEQLYRIGNAVDVDMQGLNEKTDRDAYIERLIDVIREPESTPDPLSDLRTLDPEATRDALDLRKVDGPDGLKALLRQAGLPVSGRKRDLVDRLVGHVHGGGEAAPVGAADDRDALAEELRAITANAGGTYELEALLSGRTATQVRTIADRLGMDAPKTWSAERLRREIALHLVTGKSAGGRYDLMRLNDVLSEMSEPGVHLDPAHVRGTRAGWTDVLGAAPGRSSTAADASREALHDYKSDDRYRELNAGRYPDDDPTVAGVRAAMRPLSEDVVVWRGERTRRPRNANGTEWTGGTFASTSASEDVARGFATNDDGTIRGSQPTLMRIRVPAGTPAVAVDSVLGRSGPEDITQYLDEQEILLGDGLRYRVARDYGVVHGIRRLDVEVVPATASLDLPPDQNEARLNLARVESARTIADMRAVAREHGIRIPPTETSKADIRSYLRSALTLRPGETIEEYRARIAHTVRSYVADGDDDIIRSDVDENDETHEDDPGAPDDEARARAQALIDAIDEGGPDEPDETAYEALRAAGHDVTPGHDQLHHYWTRGKGLAKWAGSAHPWTSLYHHLLKYAPNAEAAKRWASRWFIEVFHFAAGSDKNRVAHGRPPRGHRVGPG